MKTRKILVWIPILFTTLYSCQDEFCVDATTPELIIRFYDKENINNPKSISLIVWANEKDTLYEGINTDSLAVPLDTKNTSVTYHFSILDRLNSKEEIRIEYTTEDIFVSKACGFKSVFNNLNINTTNLNWIDSHTKVATKIINENEAHVKIYH
ncbi:MAG: DUF6452 family protein [Wenyingzhuangia sp.]|jgi:hypothetical protein|uniref:DUF6452 family protein n=1 Tax=Wenyingzhuangia sp. TaxID=1964193 RepID=UPI0032197F6B